MRTFIDSGVLIAAWRGEPAQKIKALTVLSDMNREFISSPFVQLEVLPKANWFGNKAEIAFYQQFFSKVYEWVTDCDYLVDEALNNIANRYGLGAVDALHIAAALDAKSDEFITSERTTSPLLRVRGIVIKTIA